MIPKNRQGRFYYYSLSNLKPCRSCEQNHKEFFTTSITTLWHSLETIEIGRSSCRNTFIDKHDRLCKKLWGESQREGCVKQMKSTHSSLSRNFSLIHESATEALCVSQLIKQLFLTICSQPY